MANLASLFAMPLALVAEDVKENQKSHHARTDSEANQKESNAENGSRRLVDIDPPLPPTGEIKLNNGHREVGGNKTSPKKKKKKKQNKRIQVHEYIDYDRKAAEEADLLNSSQWMWDDASASAARNHGPEPASSSHRAVVSYAELMHPRIFQKNARWRGKPDQGQERSNNKSVLASGNKLQSVPHSNGAPSPSTVEGMSRAETMPSSVESNNPSLAGSEIKQVHEYVDYDKRLVEDTEMHDPFARGQMDGVASAVSNHGNGAKPSSSSSQQRLIVSYEELSYPRIFNNQVRGARGRGQNFHMSQRGPNNCMPGPGGFKRPPSNFNRPPNKVPRITGGELMPRNNIPPLMPMMPCSFIDPNVTATEKGEIFAKPQPVVDPNVRKPLTNKQRKKIEKSRFYKEKLRQQLEKEKDRISVPPKKLQCRFFSNGNCNKGDDCPFSHDFVPQKRPELCKFYIMSFCERGATCIYYHGDWPCKFFHVFKSCSQGDACRFSHQPLTDETRPLLEKSLNDGAPNCSPAAKPSDPLITSSALPPVVPNNEAPRILDEKTPVLVSFYGSEDLKHTQTISGETPPAGQMPLAPNDPGIDPILQEPWNIKLKPIDLNESHLPQLPVGVESSDPMFLQDPRMERYRTTGEPSEMWLFRDSALIKSEPVDTGCDSDSFSDSKFLASSGDAKSIRSSFVSNGIKGLSGNDPLFSAALGIVLASNGSTADSKVPLSLSCGRENGRSDEPGMMTARHFSLPLTRQGPLGVGSGRLPRSRATGMAAASTGLIADPGIPQ